MTAVAHSAPARLNMSGRPAPTWASGRARPGARGPVPAGQDPTAAEAAAPACTRTCTTARAARSTRTARTTRTAEETYP